VRCTLTQRGEHLFKVVSGIPDAPPFPLHLETFDFRPLWVMRISCQKRAGLSIRLAGTTGAWQADCIPAGEI
jgi:hypothetical protein